MSNEKEAVPESEELGMKGACIIAAFLTVVGVVSLLVGRYSPDPVYMAGGGGLIIAAIFTLLVNAIRVHVAFTILAIHLLALLLALGIFASTRSANPFYCILAFVLFSYGTSEIVVAATKKAA